MTGPLIPPFRLVAEPLTQEAAALPPFAWAPPEVGRRHQLGGQPTRLQAQSFPTCPGCDAVMTFYGQLDSINDDICLADAGLVHVFVCFGCFEAVARIEST
jgi:hypothetical protein